MNFQKKPPEDVVQILNERNIDFIDTSYFAWPQIFSSTAGPHGGIGGQAISTFTVEAWVSDGIGPTVYVCSNMYSFSHDKFEPFKNIRSWVPLSQPIRPDETGGASTLPAAPG